MSNEQEIAEHAVNSMLDNDPFSQWLGIVLRKLSPGEVELEMTVRKEMLNGFAVCHGGIPFALADSACAFAANSRGRVSPTVEANICVPKPIHEGDILTARAEEISCSNRIGNYRVKITNQKDELVSEFRGVSYRTSKEFSNSKA